MFSNEEWAWLLAAFVSMLGIALVIIYIKNWREEKKCPK